MSVVSECSRAAPSPTRLSAAGHDEGYGHIGVHSGVMRGNTEFKSSLRLEPQERIGS